MFWRFHGVKREDRLSGEEVSKKMTNPTSVAVFCWEVEKRFCMWMLWCGFTLRWMRRQYKADKIWKNIQWCSIECPGVGGRGTGKTTSKKLNECCSADMWRHGVGAGKTWINTKFAKLTSPTRALIIKGLFMHKIKKFFLTYS